MKIRNMPERVTNRRAKAYHRYFGYWPDGYSASKGVVDTKFRIGIKGGRLRKALKFL